MNCLDCARDRHLLVPAAAACIDCGAGACEDHLVVRAHHLTRTEPLLRQVPVEPAARRVRCGTCDAAWQAAHAPTGSRTRAERRSA
jgi:hypothetical protein